MYRRVGEDGHFDVEDYDESSMVETTVQHDSRDAPAELAREGNKNAKETFQQVFRDAQSECDKAASSRVAPETSVDDVLKLLQTFQGGTALQQQAPAAAASQPQEEKKREEEEEEDQSEAESEDNSAAAQFGQALGKKPAAKPAPKKEAKTPAKTAAPAGTGEASTPATFALDGRGQRFKDNLQRIASELLHKFVDASNTEKSQTLRAHRKTRQRGAKS